MPICEIDPWRMQYFEHVACPADVLISTEDSDSWTWYPTHRWVYDKVAVALSQGLEAAPHGVEPKGFPVFSKPITNLKGMGVGSRVLRDGRRLRDALRARPHVDDVARRAATSRPTSRCSTARPVWWRHATGQPGAEGTFDHWTLHAEARRRDRAALRRVDRDSTSPATPA